ncbi:MAG: type II toxin-antitoxin system HicB family antitoxin [Firmicutes bacterium]|nr:type II toxin-antitoxin system HicB family antitoxin [Bacillota bacterium]
MRYIYPAFFYEETEGGYSVLFPDFPCGTCGETLQEAHYMAVDFLHCVITYALSNGEKLPAPSDIKSITPIQQSEEWTYKNVFSTLVAVDTEEYQKLLDAKQKAVRKNVTIPLWLSELAEKQHINFSSVLQDALKQRLDLQ